MIWFLKLPIGWKYNIFIKAYCQSPNGNQISAFVLCFSCPKLPQHKQIHTPKANTTLSTHVLAPCRALCPLSPRGGNAPPTPQGVHWGCEAKVGDTEEFPPISPLSVIDVVTYGRNGQIGYCLVTIWWLFGDYLVTIW